MGQLIDYFLMGLVTILAVLGGFVVFYLAYRFFVQVNSIREMAIRPPLLKDYYIDESGKNIPIKEILKIFIYLPFVLFAITLIGMLVLN